MKRIKSGSEYKNEPVGCGFCTQKHPYFDAFVSNYFKESTLHGVKYIASGNLKIIERIFWGIAVLSCFGYSMHLVLDVFSKYYASPVIISFQPKETAVSDIPFAAITICNVNMMKNSVLKRMFKNLTDEILMHDGPITDPDTITENLRNGAVILDHIAQYCLGARSFRRAIGENLTDLKGHSDFISIVQHAFETTLNDKLTHLIAESQQKLRPEIERVLDEATINCEDLVLSCLWAGQPIRCAEHFFPLETRNGRCCTFNMMPQYILQNISLDEGRAKREAKNIPNDAKTGWGEFVKKDVVVDDKPLPEGMQHSDYPRFQKAGGKPYGLSILLNPELDEYSTCTVNDGPGFKLVAHSPVSSPSIIDYGVGIPLNSEVFVDIEPHVTFANREMLNGIEIEKRGCYLAIDPAAKLVHYNFYTAENCKSECEAEHTFKECFCVAHFMPRNASQLICGAKKRNCVEGIRAKVAMTTGAKAYCKQCLPACTGISHKLQMSQFDLREDSTLNYFIYNNSEGVQKNASNYSIVHIYYGTDSVYAKERKTLYDTSDLIANAGGLLSLTLGMSIVSIVELVYFFTLRAWFEFRSIRKTKKDDSDENETNSSKTRSSEKTSHREYNDWVNRDREDSAQMDKWGGRKNLRHVAMLRKITNDNYNSKLNSLLS